MAFCLALNATASPPAILFSVALPLSPPDGVVKLTALSLAGVGGGKGFLPPAAGLFAGGGGGVGLAFAAGGLACFGMPLVTTECVWGVGRGAVGGVGGGGGARICSDSISSMYAEGVQPSAEETGLRQSHHPFVSFISISSVSPANMDNSFDLGLWKSYLTFAWGFPGATAEGAGGGGGGTLLADVADDERE